MTNTPELRLLVCSTCRRECGSALEEAARVQVALAAAGIMAQVGEFACFGGCETPISIAVQAEGRASYVFSDLPPDWPEGDIAAFCRLYLDTPAGWIEDARPAGEIRFHLRARVPSLTKCD
ncbi:DUF1636 family protein [Seohaeicola zhoushanensis]|uniref:DUF1636 domain-containing protein n=1 Tax=Seohaeicola zhoushanensis TaxID=1569283 RepID=A0A8J3M8N2_9RHOB|nr:DUF1636 family protein [Seohaeicola zhoushanensis]GHF43265.1 hypothetical protein GCM10017056_13950 [Seohaeicola zhoushanensis]